MLVFFNFKSWSKRFGPEFFTVKLLAFTVKLESEESCCMPQQYATFEMQVSAGNSSWVVSRRANDFYTLWSEVRHALSDASVAPLPVPPPKTFGSNVSEFFLEGRKQLMSDFLEALLTQYNYAKGFSSARVKVEAFLGLPGDL